MTTPASIVGVMPLLLLPEEVALAVAGLHVALEKHTDYKEAQVSFKLDPNNIEQPIVRFICDVG